MLHCTMNAVPSAHRVALESRPVEQLACDEIREQLLYHTETLNLIAPQILPLAQEECKHSTF